MDESQHSTVPTHVQQTICQSASLPGIKPIAIGRGLLPWQTARVKRHVSERLSTPIQIPDLARLVCLRSSHFSRAFKKSLGISPHAYVVRQRIERAKQIMVTSTRSLSEVAALCGFSDQASFSNVFRRFEGASPGWWRQN